MDVCTLTETKKKGQGNEIVGDHIHFYIGVEKHARAKRGVSIVVHKKLKKNIKAWEEQILKLELQIYGHYIICLAVYAPSEDAGTQNKDEFYGKFNDTLMSIKEDNETVIMGDLNARTGSKQADMVNKKKQNNPEWWAKQAEDVIKEKKKAYHHWLNTKRDKDREIYAELNKVAKRLVERSKNERWEKTFEEVRRRMLANDEERQESYRHSRNGFLAKCQVSRVAHVRSEEIRRRTGRKHTSTDRIETMLARKFSLHSRTHPISA
ncbi:uncharacterized protein LOC132697165 [Cylas formicarius]|uniref:uncharacterized protein LOC132697165 n=1 Tax=Cylas formicarius TaxID=197179 RepID=UPI002958B538|nr:uncharacterized protein LOC132697165 [Cylas formicarius]